jgi:hypothetical protein
MLCTDCSRQLKECVKKGLLSQDQLSRIIDELCSSYPNTSGQHVQSVHAEAKKTFNPIMVIYYMGALLILSAFGWFLGSQWDSLGPGGILVVSLLYALLFGFVGHIIYHRENYPVAGGLLITCCVGMTPLIVYSIQALLGIWPQNAPGSYHNYYVWINGSWIIIELATIASTFAALRKIKFSFLVMPAAIAIWFFSMDIAQIIFSSHQLSWETRSWVSVVVGMIFLVVGRILEKQSEGIDYQFWIYLAGLLSFWGGLTSLPSHGELGKLVYCVINLGLIAISLKLQRKTFAIFGAMGVFGYLGHLAWSVFKDSPLFPVALAFLGIMMIMATVVYQKNYIKLQSLFRPNEKQK